MDLIRKNSLVNHPIALTNGQGGDHVQNYKHRARANLEHFQLTKKARRPTVTKHLMEATPQLKFVI